MSAPKTARREIYARLGVQLRSNRRAYKAERIAPGAMGLYLYCVMDARAELPDLDGFVPEEAVFSAWGRPADERLAQAEALCAVDLLERVDGGFVVVKHDEHNDTRAIVEKNRKDAVKRMRRVRDKVGRTSAERSGVVQRTEGERSPDVPYSNSLSSSGYGSGSQIASSPEAVPDWWSGACDAAAMAVGGEVTERPARWAEYFAARTRKGWAMDHGDAVGWLSTVVRSERRNARASPNGKHVQSAENRAWTVPKDMP